MSLKSSLSLFAKGALTVTSLSVVAAASLPSEVLSLTTQVEDAQGQTLEQQEQGTASFQNQLRGIEKSTLLIADNDDDDDDDRKRGRGRDDDDNDDDDDDDRKRGQRRDDDDDDDDDRKGGYGRQQGHRSSKVFRVKDWNTSMKLRRLVSYNKKALVVHLDILEKPVTRYANAVYIVYARKNNNWVQVYTSKGARLIDKNAGRFFLQPEVIELNQLRLNNIDISQSELKFVTQIRYDSVSTREETLVFEDIWNYRELTEITNISQITTVSSTTTTTSGTVGTYTNNTNTGTVGTYTNTTNTGTVATSTSDRQSVTLANSFRLSYLGVSYSGNTSTWRYYMEELPRARGLSNWVLGLPSCVRVVSASPKAELVNFDRNTKISGVKWQRGGGFKKGEFLVKLDRRYAVGTIDVAAQGSDVTRGLIAGPSCSTL